MISSTSSVKKRTSSLNTIRHLLKEFPGAGAAMFWMSLASLLSNVFSLAIPIFFLQVYDRIMVHNARDTLVWLTAGIILILLLDMGVKILRSRLALWYALRFSYHREQLLMKQLYALPEDEYKTQSYAELDDKFRSILQLQGFYSGQFFQSFMDLPFVIVFLWAIYFFGGQIVYYHLLIVGVFLLLQVIYYPFIRSAHAKSSETSVKRLAFLREMLERIHFIKAQAGEEMVLRKLDGLQEELSFKKKKLQERKLQPQILGGILTQLMVYGTIVIGGFLVMNGSLTVGVVTAATMLARRVIGPLQSYSVFFNRLVQAEADLRHIKVEYEQKPLSIENIDLSRQVVGNLELRNISYTPPKNGTVNPLKDIQMIAERGTVSVILADDQAAADALRDLFLGIRKPDAGQIILDNYILSNMKELFHSDQIAVLPRRGWLFEGTILENISYFNPNLTIQALDAATLFGLDEAVAHFPRGYETEMKAHSNNTVSAGIIQRISIARAFVHRPRVVVSDRCDELMDKDTFEKFIEILEHIRSNTTVILITNRRELADLADITYILSGGRLYLKSEGEER